MLEDIISLRNLFIYMKLRNLFIYMMNDLSNYVLELQKKYIIPSKCYDEVGQTSHKFKSVDI